MFSSLCYTRFVHAAGGPTGLLACGCWLARLHPWAFRDSSTFRQPPPQSPQCSRLHVQVGVPGYLDTLLLGRVPGQLGRQGARMVPEAADESIIVPISRQEQGAAPTITTKGPRSFPSPPPPSPQSPSAVFSVFCVLRRQSSQGRWPSPARREKNPGRDKHDGMAAGRRGVGGKQTKVAASRHRRGTCI